MRTDDRGLAPIVGTALIVVVVFALSITTVVTASYLLDSSKSGAQSAAAEQTFSKFDAKLSLVALSYDTDRARYDFGGLTTEEMRINESGWIRVRTRNETAGTTKEVLLNRSFNNIEYTNPQTQNKVVYQGGGVWANDKNGGTRMISTPEFRFRGRTITIPLVAVDDDASIGNTVTMERSNTEKLYPNRSAGRTNPLKRGVVNVTVKSTYYRSWGQFFVERTDAEVTYIHDRNIVHATIRIPIEYELSNAVASKASSKTLLLENAQNVDAYDSQTGSGYDGGTPDAKLAIAGDVRMENQAKIDGTLRTQGTVTLASPQAEITGDVYCDNAPDCVDPTGRQDQVGGSIQQESLDITAPPAGPIIDSRRSDIISDNDNAAEDTIVSNRIDTSSDDTITAGNYYLTEIDTSDEVEFDTSGGNITIVVENNVNLDGAEFEVTGDNRVNIYVDGSDITIENSAEVTTGNEDATQFWMYAPAGTDVEITQGGTKFVGAIYAPSSATKITSMNVLQQAQVYGGLVGHVDNIGNNAGLHYDEALLDAEVVPENQEITYVTYVHLTVNEVTIKDETGD